MWYSPLRRSLEAYLRYLRHPADRHGPTPKEDPDTTAYKAQQTQRAIKIIDDRLGPAFRSGTLGERPNQVAVADLVNILIASGYFNWDHGEQYA